MARKTLWLLVFCAVSAGFVSAADIPSASLIPTPLEPAAVVTLTPAPEPVQIPLNWEEPTYILQMDLVSTRPMTVFRPSGASEKALFEVNLLAMVALNVADYFSTREALKYPGLSEANPLMQPFVKSPAAFAAVKIGTTALTYWSMKALFKKNRTVAWVLTTASNVLLSYVVASNMQRIHQARAL
ncbi:MAG TPA: DUF5658 family protein [Burkholderiales bacterium]|nr:DUF5658 family protein [Burkholderiales bacterium]